MALLFFNDTATTEIYTLSLHDALPICADATSQTLGSTRISGAACRSARARARAARSLMGGAYDRGPRRRHRSEEHTSELQSRQYLVCRLLLEKKTKPHCGTQPDWQTTF